jgi:shikimate kinase
MSDSGKLLARGLKGINVYLVGMMGSGKSTIGQLIARDLGYRFVDTDTIIEQVTQTTIPEIFAAEGEAGFRAIEAQVLAQVVAFQRTVVSTGGGIVKDDRNWGQMRQGSVLWLDVPLDDLFDRVRGDANRPLLNHPDPKAKLAELLAERRDRYAQADARITSTNAESPESTAHHAIEALIQVIKPAAQPVVPHDRN